MNVPCIHCNQPADVNSADGNYRCRPCHTREFVARMKKAMAPVKHGGPGYVAR